MRVEDFSIRSIELTHDQSELLFQRIIKAITRHGIENFENSNEIQVPPLTDSDQIKVFVEIEAKIKYVENKRFALDQPDAPEIESISIQKVKLDLINNNDGSIKYAIIPENDFEREHFLSIEERVQSHFTIK